MYLLDKIAFEVAQYGEAATKEMRGNNSHTIDQLTPQQYFTLHLNISLRLRHNYTHDEIQEYITRWLERNVEGYEA